MDIWPVQEVKTRFSEPLDACVTDGTQVVTRRGTETAVRVHIDEWRRLQVGAQPSPRQLLLADSARNDLSMLERDKASRRQASALR